MRAILPALCLVLLYPAAPALALDCDRSDETQTGMNICAAADYKAADAKLNQVYRKVVATFVDNAQGKKLLVTAQRAWIAFRDTECDAEAEGYAGGSMQPMIRSMCLTELTQTRTGQLEAYLETDPQ